MAGTNGGKFPEIQAHFQKNIGDVYKGLDLSFRGFPEGNVRDAEACKLANALDPAEKLTGRQIRFEGSAKGFCGHHLHSRLYPLPNRFRGPQLGSPCPRHQACHAKAGGPSKAH